MKQCSIVRLYRIFTWCGLSATIFAVGPLTAWWSIAAMADEVPQTATPALDADPQVEQLSAEELAAIEEEVAALIEQLDDDRFAIRRNASAELKKIGRPAIPAIAEATRSPSLEVKSRAFDLLRSFRQSEDEQTRQEAGEVLEELAQGDGDVAARAQAILNPPDAEVAGPQQAGNIQVFPGNGRIQIGPGNIRRQIQIEHRGQNLRLRIANNDGVKEIDAEENGRKVKIVENAEGIRMEVTEPAEEGQEAEIKVYEAEDADDLRENHPEAHKLYEKYSNQGNIRVNQGAIEIFGGGIQAMPMPVPIPVLPQQILPVPAVEPEIALPQLQQQRLQMAKEMKAALERMRELQRQRFGNAAPPGLEEQIELLEEQIGRLEAELQPVQPLPAEPEANQADAPDADEAQAGGA